MTPSNGNVFPVLLVLCEGNPQRPVAGSFDVFFDLRLHKRLSKQSIRRRFETPSRSLWRHCNDERSLKYMFILCCQYHDCWWWPVGHQQPQYWRSFPGILSVSWLPTQSVKQCFNVKFLNLLPAKFYQETWNYLVTFCQLSTSRQQT